MATSMDGGTSLNSVSVGMEEIKVLSSAMPAEYGHATSGMLIVVKKSGTNTFHGEGGYLFKSTSMMHRRFFQLQTLQQQNAQHQHAVRSSPISWSADRFMIPKIYNGRNRTFFEVAGSYHIDSSSNAGSYTTPTPDRTGRQFQRFLEPDLRSGFDHRHLCRR